MRETSWFVVRGATTHFESIWKMEIHLPKMKVEFPKSGPAPNHPPPPRTTNQPRPHISNTITRIQLPTRHPLRHPTPLEPLIQQAFYERPPRFPLTTMNEQSPLCPGRKLHFALSQWPSQCSAQIGRVLLFASVFIGCRVAGVLFSQTLSASSSSHSLKHPNPTATQ